MTAKILDGKFASQNIKSQLISEIKNHYPKIMRSPGLAVILVGNNPASEIYVRRKREACEEIGISSFAYNFPENIPEIELLQCINDLNHNPEIDSILVQMPLPSHIDENLILESIVPHKDVDGFHPYNLGRLAQRRPAIRPCTPFGIMKLLEFYHLPIVGLDCVVVGASNIVGRPMSLELLLAGATVTTCHRFTKDLKNHVQQADVLIVATGKRNLIQAKWLKESCAVIDVGMHRLENGQVCGDLDFDSFKQHVAYITPVPGGVGPMTVTMLLWNTVQSWLLQCKTI